MVTRAMAVGLAGLLAVAGGGPQAPVQDYPFAPVPFTAVHLDDPFWAPRIETNREGLDSVRLRAVRAVRALRQLPARGRRPARRDARQPAAARLSVRRHRSLQGDRRRLVRAQRDAGPDARGLRRRRHREDRRGAGAGRLSVHHAHDRPGQPAPWAGRERWTLEKDDSHELYNLGHLFEAAVAHYQATGKRTLLDVALRAADLLTQTFGPGKRAIWPGHQVTEMGLVKLYRDHRASEVPRPGEVHARRARAGRRARARDASTTSRT